MSAVRWERGSALIELTLVGLPLMFALICIFEISRAMWIYNTMAHAVKEGVRFAVVHGENCSPHPPAITNNCSKTVGDIAARIRRNGVGLEASTTTLTFTADGASAVTCLLSACVANASMWPPTASNAVGRRVQIKANAPFRSALGLFWPGQRAVVFQPFNVGAAAGERIRF